MSLQGPVVIIAPARADLVGVIENAGVFPVVEAPAEEACQAVADVKPTAIVLSDPVFDLGVTLAPPALQDLAGVPYAPMLALTARGARLPDGVLPIDDDCSSDRFTALLRAALRVRTLHASVLRRTTALRDEEAELLPVPSGDPIHDATVLVVGRGGGYPALTTAIGERVGLIGAFSLEVAQSYLNTRDVDALVIGDGFNRMPCALFVEQIGADPRFRDLPVIVPATVTIDVDPERLPFLQQIDGDPAAVVARLLPYARLHAFAARLKRMGAALDARGAIDAETGLYTPEIFVRDFSRAVSDAEERGVALALARFSLDNLSDRRVSNDAARLVGRLVRAGDFACRDRDGTILVAFSETDLRTANVVARRIASVLKHTVLAPGCDRPGLIPTITIAGMKTRDTAATLLARVTPGREPSARAG